MRSAARRANIASIAMRKSKMRHRFLHRQDSSRERRFDQPKVNIGPLRPF